MDIRSGDNVYVAMASGMPSYMLSKMAKMPIKNINVYHLLTFGQLDYLKNPDFNHISLFTHYNTRQYINETGNYIPVHFSQIPKLIRNRKIPIDVVLLEVSEADEYGFHSLGMSVECLPAAIESSNRVIACVNKFVPRTCGYKLHKSQITEILENDSKIHLYQNESFFRSEDLEVAQRVAQLIPSGATIQTGVGSIPSLVFKNLFDKKDIYIHTECLFESAVDLLESGVANGATCTLALGDDRLVKFVDNNQKIKFLPVDLVNSASEIASKNIYAINSATSIDFLGQATADYIDNQIYSGFGGIVDFMRGAASGDGLAILAMTSKTQRGISKICQRLQSPVTLTRADIDVIVTERGIVDLRGTTTKQRSVLIKEIF